MTTDFGQLESQDKKNIRELEEDVAEHSNSTIEWSNRTPNN